MALLVQEIMNREVYSARPEDDPREVLRNIVRLGITGAPVLDERGHPVGMVSFRDVLRDESARAVSAVMSSPAVAVRARTPISEAIRLVGETGYHRLAVVDDDGVAVGVVSALDLVRAIAGLPASHPAGFSHYDAPTDAVWTDDAVFGEANIARAPDGPGVLLLKYGGPGLREVVVWGEAAENVRERLQRILAAPAEVVPLVGQWLRKGTLRFRAAAVADPQAQRRILDITLGRLGRTTY